MSLTDKEKEILTRIQIPSEADPDKPEFPPDDPKFPATSTRKIDVPGFSNVWLKDESENKYSGTHKDRLAWEVVILYRDLLIAKHEDRLVGPLPKFSLISSGSAAIATGRTLRSFDLPKLKVLVDGNLCPDILAAIEAAHCEVFKTDLSKKELGPKDILALTENEEGFDLTSNTAIALDIGNYDWMSFEILNLSPDYVFTPYGSGYIYTKLTETAKNISRMPGYDKRFSGNPVTVSNCNFMGATTVNADSVADKLYSPFLPFAQINTDWLRFFKTAGYCGDMTGIYSVEEHFFERACALATDLGIECEPSGAAGLALLLQMEDEIPKDKKILIVNTGKLKLK